MRAWTVGHYVATIGCVPDRSGSRPRDPNALAHRLVAEAIGEAPRSDAHDEGKDAAAVVLGRRGGLKGGKARAAKLSAEERSEAARRAAAARWAKPDEV